MTTANKVRIYELSKALGVTNQEVIDALEKHFKLTVKTSSSSVESDVAQKLEALFKKGASAEVKTEKPVTKAKAAEPAKKTRRSSVAKKKADDTKAEAAAPVAEAAEPATEAKAAE